MTTFKAKVAACIALAWLALLAMLCAFEAGPLKTCMRDAFHESIAWLLQVAAIAAGCWLGVETSKRTSSALLGWAVGFAVCFGLAFLFFWLGFELSDRGDNY